MEKLNLYQPGYGTIQGPAYYANISGSTIYSVGYIHQGEQGDVYRQDASIGIKTAFTTKRDTAGELLEIFSGIGSIIPAKSDWPEFFDEQGSFLYRGVDLGGLIVNSGRFSFDLSNVQSVNDFLAMKAYQFAQYMVDPDTGEYDQTLILWQVAYFNLWGFLPGLFVGDPSMAFIKANNLTHLINPDSTYPEQGSKGPIDYAHFKAGMHYFFPSVPLLQAQLQWIIPMLRMEGNASALSNQNDIAEFLDKTGSTPGVGRSGVKVDTLISELGLDFS